MRMFLKLTILAACIAVALLAGGLLLNRLPWTEPPGVTARVRVYLTTNVAQTSETALFPELRPRKYPLPPEQMLTLVRDAARALGWEIVAENAGRGMLGAVVTTPFMRFKDDVTVTVKPADSGSVVHVRSQSRVGKGDLGTNTRHVIDFYGALDHLAR